VDVFFEQKQAGGIFSGNQPGKRPGSRPDLKDLILRVDVEQINDAPGQRRIHKKMLPQAFFEPAHAASCRTLRLKLSLAGGSTKKA
jgi:hypothetical protein